MRRTTILVFVLLMTAVLAACNAAASASPSASAAAASSGAGASSGASGAGAAGPELVGTAWALGDFPGQVLTDVRPTISFSGDGTVSGIGGCNTFSGTYTVDGSKLTFGALSSTKKACGDTVDTVEQAYLAALQATQTYEITSDAKLKLTSGATTMTFAVQQ
jgi:heat shock protein HslJ